MLFSYNGKRWGTYKRTSARTCSRSVSFFYKSHWCDKPSSASLLCTSIIRRGVSTFSVESVSSLHPVIEPWLEPNDHPSDSKSCLLFHLTSCKEFPWLASTFDISPHIDKLLEDFISGDILAVSDGSFNPDVRAGAAGWIVESLDGSQFIRGGGRSVGSVTAQSAYRSELIGLLGISMVMWSIEQTLTERVPSEVIIVCDGISALFKSVTKNKECMCTRDMHFDVLSAIIGYWSVMTAEPFPVHVLGHHQARRLSTICCSSSPRPYERGHGFSRQVNSPPVSCVSRSGSHCVFHIWTACSFLYRSSS